MSLLSEIEAEQVAKLTAERPVPEFAPGDTVRVHVTVLEVAETSKPERGRLRIGYRVMNQERETVMTFTSGFLVRRKSP